MTNGTTKSSGKGEPTITGMIPRLALLLMAGWLAVACGDTHELRPLPGHAQAISMLGDTLYKPELTPEEFDRHNANLLEAVSNYRMDPEEPDHLIWLGRRTAYLGEYREAVRVFGEGIFKHPDEPRLYRHRGHRYITLRLFDRAIADFEAAEQLMRNRPDAVEPDGLPNELNQPTSTLKSNVWYHKGLAHYLKGDYSSAVDSYEKALTLELTDDMRIATLYWYYMALKRNGNDELAGEIIRDITPDLELIENEVYLNLLLVFNGVFDAERLMLNDGDALSNATMGYGLGNWHYMNGREERAFEIWEQVLDGGNWPAFGYIAAEAEVAMVSGVEW
ncbi:MAG: tetratricopeptide repeat protein [Balneolaceae bacterium]